MKSRKLLIAVLVIFMLTFVLVGNSFAAGSFSGSLTPNNSRVARGSEVKVTFKISEINVDGGINGLTAVLDYDSDALELTKENVKGLNSWNAEYNADTYKLSLDKADVVTEDQEIVSFTFKVKSNTSVTTTAIKLKSIEGGNSTIDKAVSISDVTTNISISSGSLNPSSSPSSEPSSTANPTAQPRDNNTANNVVSNNSTANGTGSNGTTTQNQPVPYTGAESYVIPLMLVIAVLGIVSFVNYKRIGK